MSSRLQLTVGASVLSLIYADPGLAQDASQDPATQDQFQNEVVVVYGEKFGRTEQETSTSVGYVDSKDISAGNMLEGRDAFAQMANVGTINDGRFEIRGIAFDTVTGAGIGSLGTVYVDDIRLSDKSVRFGPDMLWDIDSIQVLRGAQSTLQGRNALAGAIYIKSQDPTMDHWETNLRAMGWTDKGSDFAAAVSGPLITDKLAFRVTAEKHQYDGSITNPVLHTDKVDYADDQQYRGKLLFTPTDSVTVHLNLIYSDTDRRDAPSDTRVLGDDGYLPADPDGTTGLETGIPYQASANRRITFVNIPEFDTTKTTAGSLVADFKLSDRYTLTSVTSGQRSKNHKQRDGDDGYFKYDYDGDSIPLSNPYDVKGYDSDTAPIDPLDQQYEDYNIFSQELRLKFSGTRLSWLGGLYYTKEEERENNFTMYVYRHVQSAVQSAAEAYTDASTAAYLASLYSDDVPLYTFNAQPVDTENYAAYGEGEFKLTERATLDFGLRYDHETNDPGVKSNGEVFGLADPDQLAAISTDLATLAYAVNTALNPFTTASQFAHNKFDAFLPKVGLRYAATPRTNIGVVYQRGYRAGGVATNPVRQIVTKLDPEYTDNFETYLRSSMLSGLANLNVNAYLTNWKDMQVSVDLSDKDSDTMGANAGKARLYGFETSFDYLVTRNTKLYAGVGYSHTEFLDFQIETPESVSLLGITVDPDALSDLEGNEFAYAPEWTGYAGVQWAGNHGYTANLNINYQGTSYADTANTRENDAHALVNISAGKSWGTIRLSAYAHNLFDTDYVRSDAGPRPVLGQPRVIGAVLEAWF